jgi:23S rRNA pseudouridine1911/1915/1917 synthase
MQADDALGPVVASVTVPPEVEQARFDRFATDFMPQFLPSRNRARKAIKAGRLMLDGELAESSRWIYPGQRVDLYRGQVKIPLALNLSVYVVYEDDELAVVLKPPGLLTNGNRHATLENALQTNLARSPKSHGAQVWLGQAFEARKVHKRYRAIVQGKLEGTREVRTDIGQRSAWTTIVPVEHTPSLHTDWTTSVDLFPHTGRTHQLRVHCASLGYPIIGDTLYNSGKTLRGKGLFLWALGLKVKGPDDRLYDWSIEEPAKFLSYRARELRRFERWHAEEE